MQNITDRELLDNYNKEIQKAEEELASLHVSERLKGLKIDREKLFAKAMRYSKYDTPLIATAISIVMSYYEGIPYEVHYSLNPSSYQVSPTDESSDEAVYNRVQINNLDEDEPHICFLPPEGFDFPYESSSNFEWQGRKIEYIHEFMNRLYDMRSQNSFKDFPRMRILAFTLEFIHNNPNLKKERFLEIEQAKRVVEAERKRKEFEESCFIDLDLICKSLGYVASQYDDILVHNIKRNRVRKKPDKCEVLACRGIELNSHNCVPRFETVVDYVPYSREQYYLERPLDFNKKAMINFFEFKKIFAYNLKDGTYSRLFLDMVTSLFESGENINSEVIAELLGKIDELSGQKRGNKVEVKIQKK